MSKTVSVLMVDNEPVSVFMTREEAQKGARDLELWCWRNQDVFKRDMEKVVFSVEDLPLNLPGDATHNSCIRTDEEV